MVKKRTSVIWVVSLLVVLLGSSMIGLFSSIEVEGAIVSGATYKITARHSGKALDVAGVSTANGADIHQWDYVGGNNQKWILNNLGNGYYSIISVHSGKAIEVSNYGTSNGDNIQQWEYVVADSQQWAIQEVESGYYRIVNRHSGKCMDVENVSQDNGATIHQWDYVGANNQKWQFTVV